MRRIAVSALESRGLDSAVAEHFGRCPHFVVVRVEDGQVVDVQDVDNPHYGHHEPGQVPQFIHGLGADVLLAGGMGGRAMGFFRELGIEGVTGAAGTVRDALERYLSGDLAGASPCRESHDHGHGAP
jgi:predicted Fe-Mo cluster-binding NifX family protein